MDQSIGGWGKFKTPPFFEKNGGVDNLGLYLHYNSSIEYSSAENPAVVPEGGSTAKSK